MIELQVYKQQSNTRDLGFRAIRYAQTKNIVILTEPSRVLEGIFVPKGQSMPGHVKRIINNLELRFSSFIFIDYFYINKVLTEQERQNNESIEQFLKADISNKEQSLQEFNQQIINFKEVIKFLKDKEQTNKLSSSPIDQIIFSATKNSDADLILKKQAHFEYFNSETDSNIYTFKEWK